MKTEREAALTALLDRRASPGRLAPGSLTPARSMSFDPSSTRYPLLARTLAVAVIAGFCSLGLVHVLAQNVAKPSRFAGAVADPEVTGSIARTPIPPSVAGGVRSVVLDPCTGRERLMVRGP